MIIKICGIKTSGNIDFVSQLPIDMIGLNFYPPSVRYIDEDTAPSRFHMLPSHIKKVGVFVNAKVEDILQTIHRFQLDMVQLHGDEDAEYCRKISRHTHVIKVFRIDNSFDFSKVDTYDMAAYFLFDTYTKDYGGSGKKFNWDKLMEYKGQKPFLLSGGIAPTDAKTLLDLDHPQFAGIDINSKFEHLPGIKDENLILPFVTTIREKHQNPI